MSKILNKINNEREGFDNDQPDSKIWDNIHQELHPEIKKQDFPWLKLVAVFVAAMGSIWYFKADSTKQNQEVAQVETYLDTIHSESNGIPKKMPEIVLDRRIIRGGNWKNTQYFMQNGVRNIQSQDVSFNVYRGNTFKSRELENNFQEVDNSNVENRSVKSEKIGTVTLNATSYSSDLVDLVTVTNACSFTVPSEYVETMHNFNPEFIYVNGNAVLRNGRQPYYEQQQVQQQELSSGYYYEQYDEFEENEFVNTTEKAVSTFGIDVDAAGYSNMRRFINGGFLPPKDAVKLEEMINYFEYKLPEPKNNRPFAVTTELGKCPWNEKNQLFQICLKGKSIPQEEFPASNLVFLIDVSGSMDEPNKLPLLKQGFKMLVKNLREKDKVSIVVYAGAAGLVLPTTSGKNKEKILKAIDNLQAGGSTAGGEGIMLAYETAKKNFIKGGNNRIILATDGDFNVGVLDDYALIRLVEEKRKTGVFISVLGFGEGNLQSSKMEKIADNGNGNYSYIDGVLEAKKVLVSEMGGTLHTIAKDVKLQLEFNPKQVKSYRLLGYENRMLATEDFENDLKDAGDLGSGHTIVALYEIEPANGENESKSKLKYQSTVISDDDELQKELLTLKFRYKEPDGEKSKLLTYVIKKKLKENMSENFRFASAVAEFGLLIRESVYKGNASFDSLIERALKSKGEDLKGYRAEFIQLAEKGQMLYEEYHSGK